MAEIGIGTGNALDRADWRRRQLERTGFPPELAERIVDDARFDVHALIELTERGCPPELAARILAPLDDRTAW